MAVSVAFVNTPYVQPRENKREVVANVTFDSSYPTGGEPLTASDMGMTAIDFAECNVKSATGGGENVANVYYDKSTAKLLIYNETPAEAGNGTDMSALVVQVKAIGY